MNSNIYNDIYQLYLSNKITLFTLIYFVLDYSISESISSKEMGKYFIFDFISDIRLDMDDYCNNLSNHLKNLNSNLSSLFSNNFVIAKKVLSLSIYDRPVMDYFSSPDMNQFNNIYKHGWI